MSPKGQFLSKGSLTHIDGRVHEVVSAVQYRATNDTLYVVPAGFRTDGASVPRALWWLYPPFGDDYEPAAILHDYLYQHAEDFTGTDPGHKLSRAEADGLMLDAMEALEFRPSGRRTIHAAIRAGGWRTWGRYRKAAQQTV